MFGNVWLGMGRVAYTSKTIKESDRVGSIFHVLATKLVTPPLKDWTALKKPETLILEYAFF